MASFISKTSLSKKQVNVSSEEKLNNVLKNVSKNSLNESFFSDENVEIIQNAIRYNVWLKTKNIIGNQSTTQLNIIMRSIYLQYSENLLNNIKEQIIRLNNMFILNLQGCKYF